MSLLRHNPKRDENESVIVNIIRAYGISVYLLDQPLDLLCGVGAVTRLAEVKMPKNKQGDPKHYTGTQKEFLQTWRGTHWLLVSEQDAHDFARDMRAEAKLKGWVV